METRYKGSMLFSVFMMAIFLMATPQVHAVPTLQLYLPDAEYIGSSVISGVDIDESWFIASNPFDLDVVGATSPSGVDYIKDVTLWIAIQQVDFQDNPGGSVTVTDYDENVVPHEPVTTEPGTPHLLSPHGIYPAYYYQYILPDLMVGTAGDSVWDYNEDYDPDSPPADTGDIQHYEIEYTGFFWLHIDLTGTAVDENGGTIVRTWTRFAPYSHDADAPNPTPEPTTMLLLSSGLIGLAGFRRRFRKR